MNTQNSIDRDPVQLSVMPHHVVAVWFSCGAASAVAAKLAVARWPEQTRILNTPVAEEDSDNQRFRSDVEKWIGVAIETVVNPQWPESSAVDVWESRRYMAGNTGAPCTLELKKRARQKWESENQCDWIVLGFTADEEKRAERFRKHERRELLTPLIDERIDKRACFRILEAAGIQLPAVYHRGYPNANCIGCVKASSPEYWNHVRRDAPDVFEARAAQSRRLGARLVRVNGKRLFLDELPENARGQPMQSIQHECGLFCEAE